MKELNIIVTTHDFVSPIRGGGGLRTVKTAIELKNRGHYIKILAPSNKNIISGVEVFNLPHISKNQSYLFAVLKFMMLFIVQLFRTKKIDMIFTHNSVSGIPAVIFGKLFNKKIIIDVTDIHTEYMKVSDKKFPMNLFVSFISKLEYYSFKHADRVIVVSNIMKNILIKKGVNADKLYVVYDGVEVNDFSPEKKKRSNFTIIHHGGIDIQDGVHYIAEAAPLILEKYPETQFLVVGDGKCLDSVKNTAIRNGVDKSFTFTGWKPYEEMKNYLKLSDIGLITRPDTMPNNTVLTLKLLEYWASGTAAVSSRLMGIEEVGEEDKDIIFFQADDFKDLARKIINLMDRKDLLHLIQQNGRSKAMNKFNWHDLINEIADIIEMNHGKLSGIT